MSAEKEVRHGERFPRRVGAIHQGTRKLMASFTSLPFLPQSPVPSPLSNIYDSEHFTNMEKFLPIIYQSFVETVKNGLLAYRKKNILMLANTLH